MGGRARPNPGPLLLLGPRPRGDDVAGRSGGRETRRESPTTFAGTRRGGGRRRAAIPGGRDGVAPVAGGAWRGGQTGGRCEGGAEAPPADPTPRPLRATPLLALLPTAEDHRPTDPTGRPRPPARTAHARARAPGADSRSPPLPPPSFPRPAPHGWGDSSASERATGRPPRSRDHVNDPSAGSPTETLLRLLLPLDSQVRPSSQRSARAVGRPRRGRSEGLTKPSNR